MRRMAAVYLVFSYGLVAVVEGRFGRGLMTSFGSFFPREIAYPVAFWVLTAAYGWWASRRSSVEGQARVSRVLLMGWTVHVNLLLMVFLATGAAANLPARLFTAYANGMAVTGLLCTGVVSWICAGRAARGALEPVWLPLAYLPAVLPLVLGWRAGGMLALGSGALAAALVWVRRRPWSAGWSRRARAIADSSWGLPLLIVLVAFVARAAAAWRLGGMGLETVLLNSDDAQQYYRNAAQLLAGERITDNWSVGYSGFVALLSWLTHQNVTAMLMVQSAISALACAGVYGIARQLHGRTAGAVAGLLCALSQLLIFNSVNLTREMASTALVVACLVLVLSLLREPPHGARCLARWTLLGLLAGALVAVDPVFLPIAGVFAVSLLAGFRRWRLRDRAAGVALFLGALLVVNAGLNASLTGTARLVGRPREYAIHVSRDFNPYARRLYDRGVNLFAFPQQSLPNALRDPLESGRLIALKVWLDFRRFFFEGQSGAFDPLLLASHSLLAAHLLFYAYAAGLIGLAAWLRTVPRSGSLVRWQAASVYGLTVLFSAQYIVLFFGMTRYRVAVQPFLLFLTALGAVTVMRRAGLRRLV